MTLRQKQESIDSLTEMLESRDQFKAERELLEQNNKLIEEINKYRKREIQLKAQINGDQSTKGKRGSKFETSDMAKLIMNLGIKKNNIIKDMGETETRGRLASINPNQRK